MDARGDLFAANANQNVKGNTITEFAAGTTPGTFRAAQIIETGLSGPIFLAFGPSISAPVPEASTTVSLGLLLALGLGRAGRRGQAEEGVTPPGSRVRHPPLLREGYEEIPTAIAPTSCLEVGTFFSSEALP